MRLLKRSTSYTQARDEGQHTPWEHYWLKHDSSTAPCKANVRFDDYTMCCDANMQQNRAAGSSLVSQLGVAEPTARLMAPGQSSFV